LEKSRSCPDFEAFTAAVSLPQMSLAGGPKQIALYHLKRRAGSTKISKKCCKKPVKKDLDTEVEEAGSVARSHRTIFWGSFASMRPLRQWPADITAHPW
jgi:hypothetical protein